MRKTTTMTGRIRIGKALILGIVALAAAFAAAAATISSPVHSASSPRDASRLAAPGQEGLDLDGDALSALRRESSASIRIEGFPIAPGETGRLILKRFEVTTPDARITVTGPEGESSLPFPSIAHFSGSIDGEPESRVYVAAQDGWLVAYEHRAAGSIYVGPDESGLRYVVRTADSPLNEATTAKPWTCGQEALGTALTANAEPTYPSVVASLSGLKQAAVRVETDHQLYVHFGSDPNAVASYAATLFGAINGVYESELSLHLAIAEVHVWTVADPYTGPDTLTQLLQLGDWWHANRPMAGYPRTMVHYLSGHPVSGGIAWLGVLCSGDFKYNGTDWGGGYGLTQVYGTYPLQEWDQYASAHEMGHNAGSPHTHCMGPPTYPDWTDKCYNGESGCYSGPVVNPGVGNGTIMSYCHLLGWQYVSMVFHARCINDRMLPEINSAACLTQASTFIDVPPSHPYFTYVETLAANSVTGGCLTVPSRYCPDAPVTRAEMAVFLLKSKYGAGHVPPAATGTVFADVHVGDFAAAWIEELYSLGITSGCLTGPLRYCPGASVTREQMAVFLLRTLNGSSYAPPDATGIFADVPTDNQYAPWIERLYGLGVTSGCLTGPLRYCPGNPASRGEMAVFLVRTFNLQ
jgi:hypothetical protein